MGDKVLRYNLRRADRKGGKQIDPWDGPYEITELSGKGLYCLINASTKAALKAKVNGCNLKPFFERATETPPPTSPPVTSSPSVEVISVREEDVTYVFSPVTISTQRKICDNSGGRLVFKKKSGPSGRTNKSYKNTSEPLAVQPIVGDGNCLFRALSFAITGDEEQHAVVRSLICDFLESTGHQKAGEMRQNKVWGTTTEILAAAEMFQLNVCVWASFGRVHTWHIHKPKGDTATQSVYLENKTGNHFNVVTRV